MSRMESRNWTVTMYNFQNMVNRHYIFYLNIVFRYWTHAYFFCYLRFLVNLFSIFHFISFGKLHFFLLFSLKIKCCQDFLVLVQNIADPIRTVPISADLIRTVPISADLIRSVPISADLIRTVPNSADLIRTIPNSVDLIRTVPNSAD